MAVPSIKSRMLYPGSSGLVNDPEVITISGSFEAKGAAQPINVRGAGFSVTWVTVGKFNITFGDLYPELICCVAGVQADTVNALDPFHAQVGIYVPATGTLQIMTFNTGATPILTDAAATTRVNFIAKFWRKNSAVVTRS